MPRAAKKKSEIDPASTYVCWMSGSALVDGQDVSFYEGERLRGDSPAVQGCPQYFVADGTPEQERPNAFVVLVERADAARMAQVSRETIYREIDRGELRARHVGRQLRIDPADFRTYLNREDPNG